MKLLVCGTRGAAVKAVVRHNLEQAKSSISLIIHGDCPDSADQWADEWAADNGIPVEKFPGTSGNYLKRNIEMVAACDKVWAFWDGWSYGTAHTVAHAVLSGKPVDVMKVRKYRAAQE